jgi:hypothetical protein
MTNLQLALTMGIPTFAVLLTFLYTNARIGSMEQWFIVLEGELRRFYETLGRRRLRL